MPGYYCHQCRRTVRLRDGDIICASCGSDFVEEVPVAEGHQEMPFPFASLIEGIMEAEGRHVGSTRAGTSADPPLIFSGIRFSTEGNPTPPNPSAEQPDNRPAESRNDASPDAVVSSFLNQLLSNLSAQGAHIQLQISRDPNTRINVIHRPMSDYVFGDGGLDEVVTQLLNQFDGGTAPVDPKYLPNLPIVAIEQRLVDDFERCPTCMEMFIKDEMVAQLDCHHHFHRDCIIPWFRRRNTCPVCRQVVNASKWLNNDPLEELD